MIMIPGWGMEKRILLYHFVVLYLNTIASVQFHLQHNQFQDVLKVLSMGSLVATIWTLALLVSRRLSAASRQSRGLRIPHTVLETVLLATFYVQIAICAVELFLVNQFDQKLTPQFFFVLFETNLNESSEFLAMYGYGKMLLPALLTALPLFLLPWLHRRRGFRLLRFAIAAVYGLLNLGLVILGYLGFEYWHREFNPSLALICGVMEYRSDLEGYSEISRSLEEAGPGDPVVSRPLTNRQVFVVIIGESTNRHHMGIYGYYRDTTPRLSAIRDDLFVFRDVISPHSHTNLVMKQLLTFNNSDNDEDWYRYPTLMNCLKQAGFRTYWVSNQETYGLWANTTTALANQADVRIFNSWRASDSDMGVQYDKALLRYLDNILQSDTVPCKFIFLHLMGNHVNYRDRYPPEFNRFDSSAVRDEGREFLTPAKKRIISEYDNAVLMSDFVVSEVIERLRARSEPGCMILLSDHGEEVYDQRDFCGHTETVGNRFMVEIPFIIWLSDSYKSLYPDKLEAIRGSIHNPWMTDDFIHVVFDLADLESDLFEPGRSVINPEFNRERTRKYGDRDYSSSVRTDGSRYLVTENFEKLWAHRVDSLGKLNEAAPIFSGVELDLVFEPSGYSGTFDVNHPPVESIHLSLEQYLSHADRFDNLHFWFDIKNLSVSNVGAARYRLEELIERYRLGNRVIIESTNPDALSELASLNGAVTSFYLPVLDTAAMSPEAKQPLANDLIRKAGIAKTNALSYPAPMHNFVVEYLYPTLQPVDLLTWLPDRQIDNAFDAPVIQQLADDPRISVILIGFPTEFDR